MKILFTLCGRAGSKGFKNKNLKEFLGVPLLYYSMAAICLYKERYEDEIFVTLNTDSKELVELAKKQNRLEFMVIDREASLGGDAVPKVSVIDDCLSKSEKYFETTFDMVVDLDITSPLRTVEDVRHAVERKAEREDVDVVYSVTGSRRNPFFNMVKEEDGYFVKAVKSEFTSRQQAPVFYDMNASIYAYSTEALKNKPHNVFFNDRADAIVMEDTAVLDIDSEEDFELMQVIAKYFFTHKDMYKRIAEYSAEM